MNKEAEPPIRKLILKTHADFGVAWDADTDRAIFYDETGKQISHDFITGLLAMHLLKRFKQRKGHKGQQDADATATIVFDAVSSKFLPDTIKRHGGIPLCTPVGQPSIKAALLKTHGIMGGEVSGHTTFRQGGFCTDNGYIPVLILIEALLDSDKRLGALLRAAGTARYHQSGEINIPVSRPEEKIAILTSVEQECHEKYHDALENGQVSISHLDGLTIKFRDSWFNIRPSNTEPLLRLRVEADSSTALQSAVRQAEGAIRRAIREAGKQSKQGHKR